MSQPIATPDSFGRGNAMAMLRDLIDNESYILVNNGAPTSGTSGTFAGFAGKGTLLIDATNGDLYQNTNTKASPTWSVISQAGTAPSHYVFAAGEFTTAGGDTDETITVAGLLATDIVFVNLHTAGATPVTIIDAAASAGQIDVDMSADPSTDHILSYMALRASS